MPIIERLIKIIKDGNISEERREQLVALPDRTGVYETPFGRVNIILCPPSQHARQANLRKMIISGEVVESDRRVVFLHPSPKKEAVHQVGSASFLSFRSNPDRKKLTFQNKAI